MCSSFRTYRLCLERKCSRVYVRERQTPGDGQLAAGAGASGKPSHLPRGERPQGAAAARPPSRSAPPRPWPQRGPATRELPRVAPRPVRAGGCWGGGGEQPGHQNRSRLWAGAALAGSLRRASSKDGQRVRRRLRPRSPLARGPAPRPEAAAGGRCGRTCRPGPAGGESGAERGRAPPRRLESPPAAEARGQWPRGRPAGLSAGPPAAPSPHL